jgi:hypothetical protein
MGRAAKDSVTDAWGRVHGMPWLRVADSSLFPDSLEINPYLTVMALADRVAEAVRGDAAALVDAGAALVAGHSAHVFHGAAGNVLYDLGDFLDDYAVDDELRNDLGLLFRVSLADGRLETIPLKLEYTYTRLADGDDARWIRRRFESACAAR